MAKYVIKKEWSSLSEASRYYAYRKFWFLTIPTMITSGRTKEECKNSLKNILDNKHKPQIAETFEL